MYPTGRLYMFCRFLDSSGTPFVPSALLRRTTFSNQLEKALIMYALTRGINNARASSESIMPPLMVRGDADAQSIR